MVPQERPRKRSAECADRGDLAAIGKILGSRNCRRKSICIANASDSPIPFQQPPMNIHQHVCTDVLNAHLANSR